MRPTLKDYCSYKQRNLQIAFRSLDVTEGSNIQKNKRFLEFHVSRH